MERYKLEMYTAAAFRFRRHGVSKEPIMLCRRIVFEKENVLLHYQSALSTCLFPSLFSLSCRVVGIGMGMIIKISKYGYALLLLKIYPKETL